MARLMIMVDVSGLDPALIDPQELAEAIVMDGPEYADGVRFTIVDNASWHASDDDPVRRSPFKDFNG